MVDARFFHRGGSSQGQRIAVSPDSVEIGICGQRVLGQAEALFSGEAVGALVEHHLDTGVGAHDFLEPIATLLHILTGARAADSGDLARSTHLFDHPLALLGALNASVSADEADLRGGLLHAVAGGQHGYASCRGDLIGGNQRLAVAR